tara:strand:+ start:58 stop:423 length:366 start_codon:yes stop_codon:yes gene_type:complete
MVTVKENEYEYFKIEDFNCQETGENKMSQGFIRKLDLLRGACGFPFHISSGYRSPNHSIEKRKENPGTHAQGIAADIYVNGGRQRMQLVRHATALGFNGIGVAKAFVHVDIRDDKSVLWCY